MTEPQIYEFLQRLGVSKAKTKINAAKTWVQCPCPLAKWSHSKGRDDSPSFGISIEREDDFDSLCKCYSCGFRGLPFSLVGRLQTKGMAVGHLTNFLAETAKLQADQTAAKLLAKATTPKAPLTKVDMGGVVLPSTWVSQEDADRHIPDSDWLPEWNDLPERARRYLNADRRLTDLTIAEWGLGYVARANRVAIPQRDSRGRLVNISGRLARSVAKDEKVRKIVHAEGARVGLYLFGENMIPKDDKGRPRTKSAIIVEGPFDAMYLWQYGYRCPLALYGVTLSRVHAEKLCAWVTDRVYLCGDGDEAGRQAMAKWKKVLEGRIAIEEVPLPEGADPDNLSGDQLRETFGPPENFSS